MLVSPRTETFGFTDGVSDIPVPDEVEGWTQAVDHAAERGLGLWVHIDPWTIGNVKARVAAIHNLSSRTLRTMESRRVSGEQRVYFRFS